jgi:hypothetical protein
MENFMLGHHRGSVAVSQETAQSADRTFTPRRTPLLSGHLVEVSVEKSHG